MTIEEPDEAKRKRTRQVRKSRNKQPIQEIKRKGHKEVRARHKRRLTTPNDTRDT